MLKSRLPQIAASLPVRVNVALRVGAGEVEQSAKQRVHRNSGNLHDAIHVERHGPGYYVVAGNDDVFYGHLEEFGTSHSAPHPFLTPAFEEQRDAIVQGVAAAIRGI